MRRQQSGEHTSEESAGETRFGSSTAVLDKATRENFPVAPFFLPPYMRQGLMAVYGFARLVDDSGDGDLPDPRGTAELLGVDWQQERDEAAETAFRLALLDALDADVDAAFERVLRGRGEGPRHPLIAALVPVIDEHGLTVEPFRGLIEANRVDQRVATYQTFDDLMGYCELSANPVGRLVLQLAHLATPERVRWSDAVCSALQVVEHLQDVAEDRARGRVYLPQQDMKRFGVTERELDASHAGTALRGLVLFEAERARALLDEGAPLIGSVSGRLRVLLAGFSAGGYAALGAVAAAGYDVLAGAPKAGKGRLATEAVRALLPARPARGTRPAHGTGGGADRHHDALRRKEAKGTR
ncbi:squalene synthase HpnC [Streptacidiphilus fuscans]|uniref:Squalene synthase HpnC n=1 Tax=Streptacidiphilus fuscans TaxID=2789292 RepID=A0A931B2R2_9ACTN|nr:squalene synthase HpnC [Streptacidiphilus fuscans]MBF9070120.1 squalene synthase HpnC [Streptacidiphilus fuscans]